MLDINFEFRRGVLFIRLRGILTKNTVKELDSEVTTLIRDNGIRNVVFNVSELSKIHATIDKISKQQRSTVWQRELYSVSCNNNNGKESENVCICVYITETNTTLKINYTSIKK